MTDGRQVDPDLVRPARLQPALDKGADRMVVLGEDLVARVRRVADRPMGASIVPRLASKRPQASAR
jgi:hypothetical protein